MKDQQPQPSKGDRIHANVADLLAVYDEIVTDLKARGAFGLPFDGGKDPPVATGLVTPYLVFDKAGSIWYRSQYGEPKPVRNRDKPNGGD